MKNANIIYVYAFQWKPKHQPALPKYNEIMPWWENILKKYKAILVLLLLSYNNNNNNTLKGEATRHMIQSVWLPKCISLSLGFLVVKTAADIIYDLYMLTPV